MKKILKCFLSVMLSLTVLFGAGAATGLGIVAVQAAEVVDSGTCGDNLTWTFNSAGKLTIKGTGKMTSNPWESLYQTQIKRVVLRSGVTSVSDFAFEGCDSMTSLVLSDTTTAIGECAFSGCSALTSLTLPDSMTKIDALAFYGCTGLKTVTIPKGVTKVGTAAFSNCDLDSISVDSANTTYDSRDNCGALIYTEKSRLICGSNSTVIPDSVRIISENAFCGCTQLTNVTIPEGVSILRYSVFAGCSGLKSIALPSTLTSIEEDAFYKCSALTGITLPANLTSIGESAFAGCTALKVIKFPAGFTSIDSYTFSGCSGLVKVVIPASVTLISEAAFMNCTGIANVYYKSGKTEWKAISIGANNTYLTGAARHYKYDPDGTTLKSVTAISQGFTVKWKKHTSKTNGYQLQYSTSKTFASNKKAKSITSNTTTSHTFKKLAAKTKYYVRIRTYRIVDGTKYYSTWSDAMAVKTKA